MPFRNGGICPLCGGNGKKAVVTTENINLGIIYDYRDFLGSSTPVNIPDGFIQTVSKKETIPKLLRAKELQPSIAIKNYVDSRFERASEPQPVGFGNDNFVFCNWKKDKIMKDNIVASLELEKALPINSSLILSQKLKKTKSFDLFNN